MGWERVIGVTEMFIFLFLDHFQSGMSFGINFCTFKKQHPPNLTSLSWEKQDASDKCDK
jgi:hypothetical protein